MGRPGCDPHLAQPRALRPIACRRIPGSRTRSPRAHWQPVRYSLAASSRARRRVRPPNAPRGASMEGEMPLSKRLTAEFVGTLWLVLGGCGSAVLAAAFPNVGIGLTGVSFAFGLTVLTMAYAIGHISGCHLNPAVSVGLVFGGRFKGSELAHYIVAQVLGAIAAAA